MSDQEKSLQISNGMLVKVIFYHSQSKLYNRAIGIARCFPLFVNQGKAVYCAINSAYDFCKLQRSLRELIQIIANWKFSEIWLYGKQLKAKVDYYDFLQQLKQNAGKYAPLIDESESNVSHGQITIEDLPYPIVYYPENYGAFFAFAKDIGEPIVFCECERHAIENYIKIRKRKPLLNYIGDKTNPLGTDCFPLTVSQLSKESFDPLSKFEFKADICFRCKKIVPRYAYCLPMYGSNFKQHYGWYIQQEYYKLGVDKYQIGKISIPEEICDPEIYDSLKRLSVLHKKKYTNSSIAEINEAKKLKKQIDQTVENSVRAQLGFRKIGDTWISETILYEIVCQIFEGNDVVRHYRPFWLKGLELDIFVPNHNIAFEYQGIQHFRAVNHWGGERQLQKQKEHDTQKKRICSEKGIRLICINYNEPLTTEFVIHRIKN